MYWNIRHIVETGKMLLWRALLWIVSYFLRMLHCLVHLEQDHLQCFRHCSLLPNNLFIRSCAGWIKESVLKSIINSKCFRTFVLFSSGQWHTRLDYLFQMRCKWENKISNHKACRMLKGDGIRTKKFFERRRLM
jgi:hypothetical protein